MKRRAVLSVSDKTGIVDLARGLADLDFELVSTGGTYKTIKEAGIPVTYVTEVTGFPEILDGRVKTLHPAIHGGILARGSSEHMKQLKEQGIVPIELVVVNLYPFKQTIAKPGVTFEEAIENIDIGGPTMVRAAAKNHERVAVVVNPERYGEVLESLRREGEVPLALRKNLAAEAFAHTADYDAVIAGYLGHQLAPEEVFPPVLRFSAERVQSLRYGENPQQKAAFYRVTDNGEGTLAYGRQLQGKELSFNNLQDMDAAWRLVQEFDSCAAAIIKHMNPCGAAIGTSPLQAYERALAADPVSAYGGIIAFNQLVDGACAKALKERFYEVIIAPEFSREAQEILKAKVKLRLFEVGNPRPSGEKAARTVIKSIDGGYLMQEEDLGTTDSTDWKVVTQKRPEAGDLKELEFVWKIVKHVKSNAIVVGKDGQTLGVGAGQMNRVGSARIALEEAGERVKGAYLASDAFFPFADSIEEAAKAGIKAIIQPGGSIRDQEVIEAADRHGLIMVFTQRRHFWH